MNKAPEWLVKLIILAILPLIMCFGYYSLELVGSSSVLERVLATIAVPLLLLGVGGLVWSRSDTGVRGLSLLWWGCVLIALVSLYWIWG